MHLSVTQVVREPFAAMKGRGTTKRTYSKGGDCGGSKAKKFKRYG